MKCAIVPKFKLFRQLNTPNSIFLLQRSVSMQTGFPKNKSKLGARRTSGVVAGCPTARWVGLRIGRKDWLQKKGQLCNILKSIN